MGIFGGPQFKDLTMKDGFMECHIRFSRFGGRFEMAQKWFDKTLANKMYPVMPYKTGALMNQTKMINDILAGSGRLRTYGLSYGKRLYPGINPNTGLPFHWTNPLTQPMWGSYAYQTNKVELQKGIKQIIIKGKAPDGG